MLLDDMSDDTQSRWSYVADTVMGGVSRGQAVFGRDDQANVGFIQLTGKVSTDNNGGFIQVRRALADGLPANTKSLRLTVRGNGETYYVFLRSRFGTRPWHSYRQEFATGAQWTDITLPIADFYPSREELPETIGPSDVTAMGLVAYGRELDADLSIARITVE
ncbi:MAG: CIA30 family protein [Pseudomonadota bacterium]